MTLHQTEWLRQIALPVFERVNPGTITIRHHWTGQNLRLHSYRHKGYWYHGRSRERATVLMLLRLIQAGDTVLEAGGHIGYFSLIFATQVGPGGFVFVFEPGPNNLPYLEANVSGLGNLAIVESALADKIGTAEFYVEALTGQNNSLFEDYEAFDANRRFAHSGQQYRPVLVPVDTIDGFLSTTAARVDWIKMDIEGAECDALLGAENTLASQQPGLMVEVTRRNDEVRDLLVAHGYALFLPSGAPIPASVVPHGNVFALHRERHGRLIAGVAGS